RHFRRAQALNCDCTWPREIARQPACCAGIDAPRNFGRSVDVKIGEDCVSRTSTISLFMVTILSAGLISSHSSLAALAERTCPTFHDLETTPADAADAGRLQEVDSAQMPDPGFDARVASPTYTATHPKVLIDEAHQNFHTAAGRYKPFADLIGND